MQGFKEWAVETGDAQGDGEYDPVFKHVESVATHLSNLEKQVACPWDPTLEADLPLLKGQKYLIAANFRNNEDLLPHLIVQLWHLLAILPQGSAFVSVYESGSTDSTGEWLSPALVKCRLGLRSKQGWTETANSCLSSFCLSLKTSSSMWRKVTRGGLKSKTRT